MSKKIILPFIFALLIIGVVFLVFWGKKKEPEPGESQVLGPPTVNSSGLTPPAGDTIVIDTEFGSVSVRNFYKNPIEITPDQEALLLYASAEYDISYYIPDSSFTIGILSKPVEAVKKKAEEEFLNNLQISKEDACKLLVWVGVPVSVDENLAGLNLGLSFCEAR